MPTPARETLPPAPSPDPTPPPARARPYPPTPLSSSYPPRPRERGSGGTPNSRTMVVGFWRSSEVSPSATSSIARSSTSASASAVSVSGCTPSVVAAPRVRLVKKRLRTPHRHAAWSPVSWSKRRLAFHVWCGNLRMSAGSPTMACMPVHTTCTRPRPARCAQACSACV